jgi:hypothetical protein
MKLAIVFILGIILGAGTMLLLPLLFAHMVERAIDRIVFEIEEEVPEDYKLQCDTGLEEVPLPKVFETWVKKHLQ